MSAETIVHRLRWFLLLTVGAVCLGTVAELILHTHFDEPIQLIPFALCGLGFIAVVAVLYRPNRGTVQALRGTMALLIGGGVLGGVLHLIHNFEHAMDHADGFSFEVLVDALLADVPLLAPGIMILAGILAIAATYYHPALQTDGSSQNNA